MTDLVPDALRVSTGSLWRFATTVTAVFGTPLARVRYVGWVWRLPMTVLWFSILLATSSGVAGRGDSWVSVTAVDERRQRVARWALLPMLVVVAVVCWELGARPTTSQLTSPWAWLVILVIVESAPMLWRGLRAGRNGARLLAEIRTAGHDGLVVEPGLFVRAPRGRHDGLDLGQAVLAHLDRIGAAVIVNAANDRVARGYAASGFRRTSIHKLALIRLPGDTRANRAGAPER